MWPCDQSLVTLLFLWKKLSYPRFYMDLTWKINFFEVCSLFKFNNLVQALDLFLRFYTTFTKELKLIQKDFWANIYVYRNYWVKTGGRAFLTSPPPPSLWPSIICRRQPLKNCTWFILEWSLLNNFATSTKRVAEQ